MTLVIYLDSKKQHMLTRLLLCEVSIPIQAKKAAVRSVTYVG